MQPERHECRYRGAMDDAARLPGMFLLGARKLDHRQSWMAFQAARQQQAATSWWQTTRRHLVKGEGDRKRAGILRGGPRL